MVEAITQYDFLEDQEVTPPKKISLTKTIRFSEKDRDLWEFWNKDTVKLIKDFLREQLSYKQRMERFIKEAEHPQTKRQELLKEKRDLIKFMIMKEASQETIDRLSKEYSDLLNIKL